MKCVVTNFGTLNKPVGRFTEVDWLFTSIVVERLPEREAEKLVKRGEHAYAPKWIYKKFIGSRKTLPKMDRSR
jgi:hypothetical protein